MSLSVLHAVKDYPGTLVELFVIVFAAVLMYCSYKTMSRKSSSSEFTTIIGFGDKILTKHPDKIRCVFESYLQLRRFGSLSRSSDTTVHAEIQQFLAVLDDIETLRSNHQINHVESTLSWKRLIHIDNDLRNTGAYHQPSLGVVSSKSRHLLSEYVEVHSLEQQTRQSIIAKLNLQLRILGGMRDKLGKVSEMPVSIRQQAKDFVERATMMVLLYRVSLFNQDLGIRCTLSTNG